jgi:hypothetical protein
MRIATISATPLARQTRKRAAESQKWKEHNQRQKGAWRQYEESKHRPAYDGSYSLCTADESQATADSQKRKEPNERQKCFDENINKGNAVTKAQTYGDCQ